MTKKELEAKVEEIRKYKTMIEEASNIENALEAEVISYMNENNHLQKKLQTRQKLPISRGSLYFRQEKT